jgi:hypothetical protein
MSVMSVLTDRVLAPALPQETIRQHRAEIRADVLRRSRYIKEPNFTAIHPSDVELLFDAYDHRFFAGCCKPELKERPLRFGVSSRLTVSGGVTKRIRSRVSGDVRFEIVIAGGMLFAIRHIASRCAASNAPTVWRRCNESSNTN